MKVYEHNNDVILEKAEDFNLTHIFECGQCFRWDKFKDGYSGVAMGRHLYVSQSEKTVTFHSTDIDTFNGIWMDYFDLNRNYSDIKNTLCTDSVMKKAADFGDGIRILNQDAFECLISFIISASNNIPRIKKIISLLCENFGDKITNDFGTYHLFPTAKQISKLSLEDLSVIRAGFRDKYILATAKAVASGQTDLAQLKKASFDYAESELLKLPGVGKKVASCILLFGLQKYEGFPVDVWVKRIMEYCYFDNEQDKDTISAFAKEQYGALGGFAQQYLFYWARENKIGI